MSSILSRYELDSGTYVIWKRCEMNKCFTLRKMTLAEPPKYSVTDPMNIVVLAYLPARLEDKVFKGK